MHEDDSYYQGIVVSEGTASRRFILSCYLGSILNLIMFGYGRMDDKQAIVDDDGNAEGQDVKDVSVKSKIDAIFSSPTG